MSNLLVKTHIDVEVQRQRSYMPITLKCSKLSDSKPKLCLNGSYNSANFEQYRFARNALEKVFDPIMQKIIFSPTNEQFIVEKLIRHVLHKQMRKEGLERLKACETNEQAQIICDKFIGPSSYIDQSIDVNKYVEKKLKLKLRKPLALIMALLVLTLKLKAEDEQTAVFIALLELIVLSLAFQELGYEITTKGLVITLYSFILIQSQTAPTPPPFALSFTQ